MSDRFNKLALDMLEAGTDFLEQSKLDNAEVQRLMKVVSRCFRIATGTSMKEFQEPNRENR